MPTVKVFMYNEHQFSVNKSPPESHWSYILPILGLPPAKMVYKKVGH